MQCLGLGAGLRKSLIIGRKCEKIHVTFAQTMPVKGAQNKAVPATIVAAKGIQDLYQKVRRTYGD